MRCGVPGTCSTYSPGRSSTHRVGGHAERGRERDAVEAGCRPRTTSPRPPHAASARRACRARRAGPPAMIATRSQSCSASSMPWVVSITVVPSRREGRARAPRWSRVRAGPCRPSVRRGTRPRAGRSARTRARAAAPARPTAAAPACADVSRRPTVSSRRIGRSRDRRSTPRTAAAARAGAGPG